MICGWCNTDKAESEFYPSDLANYQYRCRECHKARKRKDFIESQSRKAKIGKRKTHTEDGLVICFMCERALPVANYTQADLERRTYRCRSCNTERRAAEAARLQATRKNRPEGLRYLKNGKLAWTPELDAELLVYREQGLTFAQISEKIGKTPGNTWERYSRLTKHPDCSRNSHAYKKQPSMLRGKHGIVKEQGKVRPCIGALCTSGDRPRAMSEPGQWMCKYCRYHCQTVHTGSV